MTEKQYISAIIRYFGIYCHQKFITPLDFHFLCDWWNSGIPLEIVRQSIQRVAARRRVIRSFWNFQYEVNKNNKTRLQLQVGSQQPDPEPDTLESHDAYREEMTAFQEDSLLESFQDDQELNIKTKIFMRSLAPSYRTAENEKLYRINYIFHRLRLRRRANVYQEYHED
jgi:hypothetical protein